MIPKDCKRLAEVDFPIAVVSTHAVREKAIRHGHPSTLHLWWARRPLAACRAMLLGLLLPDPCDESCPPDFKSQSRALLAKTGGKIGPTELDLRQALLAFIGDFANWDNAAHPVFLEVGRGLVRAAHGDEPPLVVDPFAGGGSIPLEALRLGCNTFASDLNPVACLILKVLLEDIPRHGPELAEELRRVGAEVKQAAEKELAEFYPVDPDGARPIAYMWARTVRCETPHCGAEIPLVRSFWLRKKANRRRALRSKVVRPKGQTPQIDLEIFEPLTEEEVAGGTVSRAKATCLCCGTVLSPDRVRAQLREQRGGADVVFDTKGRRTSGARLLAVVTLQAGEQGRQYRLPADKDYQVVWTAMQRLVKVSQKPLPGGLSPLPDEPTPAGGGSGAGRAFSVQKYGMMKWGDLFTARQKLALMVLRDSIAGIASENGAAKEIAGLALSRFADISNALCQWENTKTQVRHLFTRQAIPILWDFAEPSAFGDQAGDYAVTLETMARVIAGFPKGMVRGQVQIADACESPVLPESASVWFTDPPYYDAIPYSDLSDFFFVWLKRILPGHPLIRDPFDPKNLLTPKIREVVQDETKRVQGRAKDRLFFEETMARAFQEGYRGLQQQGVGCVVFAHKTTEGWEALLSGMIRGGWVITGSWPISTELGNRLRARDSAALATSIHLVCRPRTEDHIGDWTQVYRELPKRVGEWMDRLQAEGIRGADLVFACIGPALEIYSRYAKVVDADEREIPLGGDPAAKEPHRRGYLAYVWEAVGRAALQQVLGPAEARARNGAGGALEEDARLTALFLWTLQSTPVAATAAADEPEEDDGDEDEDAPKASRKKGFTLVFDVVRRFAQPLGIRLPEWEGRITETKKGVVRLLPVPERSRQLFGEEGPKVVEELARGPAQLTLFPEMNRAEPPPIKGRSRGRTKETPLPARREPTTLDRVHAAMLLQAGGRTTALRGLLRAEQERGPEFLRLANALSALYPRESEEKRLLDATLLAVPR